MQLYKELAKSIDLLMREQGRSRKEMAALLGVAESRASLLANGKASLTVEQLFAVSDWLGVGVDDLRRGYTLTSNA